MACGMGWDGMYMDNALTAYMNTKLLKLSGAVEKRDGLGVYSY
jgi:hypothetical protein